MSDKTKILNVELADKSYPIYIGSDLLSSKSLLSDHIQGKQVMVVTNSTIAPLYLEKLKDALSDFNVESVILPDGEEFKTLETLNKVFDALLKAKFDRSSTLVALGGGVVGDITGYAAASYQRGVNFIQLPTSLLSQVDSSVGGKTGVNHELGKNMIGAFYQPKAVIIDVDTLDTLSDQEYSAGMAEVIKYGLLGNADFFSMLETNIESIMARNKDLIIEIIFNSCKDKASIVALDEFERGKRALLNLGHTFGHGIENAFGYGNYLHGEAVSIGMVMAAKLSMDEGHLSNEDAIRVESILSKADLPISIKKSIGSETLIEAMSLDKKSIDGKIRLVLLKALGDSYLTDSYSKENFNKVVNNFCQ
ncbi:3-dehydroquinate synthase [Candidatus Thioglobus sp.]|nr:3-dehydroquinate synthase [Candidatus Thioglobus sp.]